MAMELLPCDESVVLASIPGFLLAQARHAFPNEERKNMLLIHVMSDTADIHKESLSSIRSTFSVISERARRDYLCIEFDERSGFAEAE